MKETVQITVSLFVLLNMALNMSANTADAKDMQTNINFKGINTLPYFLLESKLGHCTS